MIGGGDDDEIIAVKRQRDEIQRLWRLAHDGHVHIITFEARQHLLAIGDIQTDIHLRMLEQETRQQFHREGVDRRGESDAQLPLVHAPQVLQGTAQALQFLGYALPKAKHLFAGIREKDLLSDLLCDRQADLLLELADLQIDRRLRQIEPRRGPGIGAGGGQHAQDLQLP